MISETPYEPILNNFVPNAKRGHWANPSDFLYASIALVFRMDFFHLISIFTMPIYSDHDIILVYIIALLIFNIPQIMLHSYFGQFSSSSYISAFRINPVFKCLGYMSLFVNLCTIIYFSTFAVVPLVYMLASLQPTLPWSCEGYKNWASDFPDREAISLCDSRNGSDHKLNMEFSYRGTSALYLDYIFDDPDLFRHNPGNFRMSWQLSLCSIGFWSLMAFIIYTCFEPGKMGQLIRYSVWIFLTLLFICLIRFSCLPEAKNVYRRFFIPPLKHYIKDPILVGIYGLAAFGPGWGHLITLASFNKFGNNIRKSSWIIGVAQILVLISLHLLRNLIEQYFKRLYIKNEDEFPNIYLYSGSIMAAMEWPNFWCVLFFFMLFLGAFVLMIIQLYSILTSIFDEFHVLMLRKTQISMMITFLAALCSQYYITNQGISYYKVIEADIYVIQIIFNFLLIVVVCCFYGHSRFQRDIEFMIKESFSTWHICILKFLVPVFIFMALLFAILIAVMLQVFNIALIEFNSLMIISLPLIFIPLYCIYFGDDGANVWHPVDAEEEQRYEEYTSGAMLMTQV